MKQIINGLLYDITTAVSLGKTSKTELFRTPNGRFFFFNDIDKNFYSCDEEEAKDWAENNISVHEYLVIWPDIAIA